MGHKNRLSRTIYSERKVYDLQKQILEHFDELDLGEMKTLLDMLNVKLKNAEIVINIEDISNILNFS